MQREMLKQLKLLKLAEKPINQTKQKKKTLYKVFASSFDYSPLILALM